MAPDPIIVTVMGVVLAATVGIGLYSYKRAKSESEYFAYGKSMNWFFLGLATFASILSGFGFVGGPGLVYGLGTTSLWMTFAAGLGIPLAFLLVGKKLQRLGAGDPDVLTIPDAVYKRYKSQAARAAVAIGILIGILAYLGAQLLAAGIVLTTVFDLSTTTLPLLGNLGFNLPIYLVGVLLIAIYPLVGGIVAGVNTDVLQGSIMVVAAVLIFGFAVSEGGGMDTITANVSLDGAELVGAWGAAPAILPLSWLFVFSIGVIGMPHSTSKFLMIKDEKQLRYGVLLATAAYMIGSLLWMIVGWAMRAQVATGAIPPLATDDQAAPVFLATQVPSILAGVTFAGLASAILSTASTFLNVGASAITRDIPLALGRPLRDPVLWGRISTGAIAVLAAVLAVAANEQVALIGAVGFGLHAAALVPALALGLYWKRANAQGVVASVGVAVVLSVYFLMAIQFGFAARFGWWVPTNGFFAPGIALILSLLTFILVSFLTTAPVGEFEMGDDPVVQTA